MTSTTSIADYFDGADFAPEKQVIPWLQILHNEDAEKSGFFLTKDNIESSGIAIPSHWKLHKARFKSGELNKKTNKFEANTSEGVLFQTARLLVLRTGMLTMYTKRSGNVNEAYLGKFDYNTYQAQKTNLTLKTKHLVYLLADDNTLLHQSPLQFSTRGVFGATFAQHLNSFQGELQRCYGKQRGDKFLMNGVFVASTASELRGSPPDTAWVTVVESHEVPTPANWKGAYFVGYDEQLREKLLADYEAFADFDARVQPTDETNTVDPVTGEILSGGGLESLPDDSLDRPMDDPDIPW